MIVLGAMSKWLGPADWVVGPFLLGGLWFRLGLGRSWVLLALLDLLVYPFVCLARVGVPLESRPMVACRLAGLLLGACLLALVARGGSPPAALVPVTGRWTGRLLAGIGLLAMIQAGPWWQMLEFTFGLVDEPRMGYWGWFMFLTLLFTFVSVGLVLWYTLAACWERGQPGEGERQVRHGS